MDPANTSPPTSNAPRSNLFSIDYLLSSPAVQQSQANDQVSLIDQQAAQIMAAAGLSQNQPSIFHILTYIQLLQQQQQIQLQQQDQQRSIEQQHRQRQLQHQQQQRQLQLQRQLQQHQLQQHTRQLHHHHHHQHHQQQQQQHVTQVQAHQQHRLPLPAPTQLQNQQVVPSSSNLQNRCRSPLHPIHHGKSMGDNLKPAHSYIGLIGMCILSVPEKRMVLNDIYQFILDNYPYYRNRGSGWRNSVRHNLSLNECFQKNGRAANGKGHYWTIHPANMEDFMLGDFRRRRAQRKVRRWNNMDVPSDESDDESMEDATKPPLPEHFKRSLEMHRRLEENYRKQAEAASAALAAVSAAAVAAATGNNHNTLSLTSPSPTSESSSPLYRRKEIP